MTCEVKHRAVRNRRPSLSPPEVKQANGVRDRANSQSQHSNLTTSKISCRRRGSQPIPAAGRYYWPIAAQEAGLSGIRVGKEMTRLHFSPEQMRKVQRQEEKAEEKLLSFRGAG
ncbi:hypothetical protein MHYP_G00119980 [Metynnis hypsauchen]